MPRPLLLAALLTLAPAALAQDMALDAAPAYGTLRPTTEAATLEVVARGGDEFPDALLYEGCVGFVTRSSPDAVVDWGGGDLRLWVRAAFDPTLAVHGPDGWTCADDSEEMGALPVVDLRGAPAGRYAVWVGTFALAVDDPAATLTAGPPPPAPTLDPDAAPAAGRVDAAGGFEAARGAIELAVTAGGPDMGSAIDPFCNGALDAGTPSATVDYDAAGGTGALTLGARPLDDDLAPGNDLVLLVVGPDGAITCNDDFYGVDPVVAFDDPASGRYAVWVGTYRAGSDGPATLTVSETAPVRDDDVYIDEGFGTPYSEGSYTPLDLDAVPGPRAAASDDGGSSVAVTVAPAGGNPVQGPTCAGSVEPAPTAGVTLTGAGPFALRAAGDVDLTLTVRTPSGGWLCSDDADGLDPGIQIDDAEGGLYRVWVGAFSDDGSDVEAVLTAEPGTVEYDFSYEDIVEPLTQSDGAYAGGALTTGAPAVTAALEGATSFSQEVTAGGPVLNPVEGEACAGFLPDAPTAALTVAEAGPLTVAAADDGTDLTLVVRGPTDAWTCSDDADGSDPAIRLDAEPGTYEVWVGTFSRRDEPVSATLTVER